MVSSDINILIKTPNRVESQHFSCDPNWKVKNLKKLLNESHYDNPPIEDQRLIYCGHLLNNEDFLKDVFQPIDNGFLYTVHLVFKQKIVKEKKIIKNEKKNECSSSQAQNINSNLSNSENGNISSINGLNTNIFLSSNLNISQYMQFYQQLYIQYMSAHQMNLNSSTSFNQNSNLFNNNNFLNSPVFMVPNPLFFQMGNTLTNPNISTTIINSNDRNDNRIDQPNNNNQINRDTLNGMSIENILKHAFKLILLICLILNYSSFERTFLVFTISLVIYLYNLNRQGINRNIQNNIQNAQNVQNVQNVQNNLQGSEEQIQETMNSNIHNSQAANVLTESNQETVNSSNETIQNLEPYRNKLKFIWMIISSIFTSLVPEPAPAV